MSSLSNNASPTNSSIGSNTSSRHTIPIRRRGEQDNPWRVVATSHSLASGRPFSPYPVAQNAHLQGDIKVGSDI